MLQNGRTGLFLVSLHLLVTAGPWVTRYKSPSLCFKEKCVCSLSCPFFSNPSAKGKYPTEPRSALAWRLSTHVELCLLMWCHVQGKYSGQGWYLAALSYRSPCLASSDTHQGCESLLCQWYLHILGRLAALWFVQHWETLKIGGKDSWVIVRCISWSELVLKAEHSLTSAVLRLAGA